MRRTNPLATLRTATVISRSSSKSKAMTARAYHRGRARYNGGEPDMASPGLLDRARSVLVVVDLQEKLLPAIPDRDRVLGRVALLLDAARALGVPVISTEQYPRGLGATVEAVRVALPAGT